MIRQFTVGIAAFALLAAACGQYPGVHEQAVASGEIAGGGTLAGAGGGVLGEGGTTATGTTGTGGTNGTTGTGGTSGTSGGTSGGGGGAGVPTGGDITGVTSTSITIGIHAPLTGAAPLRASSFNAGKDLYWEKGNNGKPVVIHGRRVKVVFQDDQYNPSHARLVCQQMAEQEKAFLLVGGGGTDQIQACAQYAASRGIPYLSAGVTENQLRSLGNYFAVSMSYAQQAPLLAQYIKKNKKPFGWNGEPSRVAMVATNTTNFDDAVSAFQQAMPGITVFRPEKNERGSSMAGRLCTGTVKNFDVVYPLTAPTYYLEMAGAAKCQPQYAGVGITMGLDQVARTACQSGQSSGKARFFSPGPAFADSDKYDRGFRQAGGSDDIMFLLWGLSKALHALLDKAGPNLTREQFVASSSTATVNSGVYPDLRYSQSDHFGADQVHVLKNQCSGPGGEYVTEAAFKRSF
jgi:branched-chain amino acid transport system substrate-binding protein